MVGLAGETAIAVTVGADTVRDALPLRPSKEAVTMVDPGATAVAMPEIVTVATLAFASVHVANLVTSADEPSL